MQLFSHIAWNFNSQNDNGVQNLFNFSLKRLNFGNLWLPPTLASFEEEDYNFEAQNDLFVLEDSLMIERAIAVTFRDWYPNGDFLDHNRLFLQRNRRNFDPEVPAQYDAYNVLINGYPFHLIYSFLIENTRIIQIFEKVLSHYVNSEVLTLANRPDQRLQNWVRNSEALFFRDPSASSFRNTVSRLRDREEAVRRNAYYRLFGMDLSHGDINNPANPVFQYQRSNINNREFVTLFSKLLSEIWQGYINRNNNVNANTTDINSIDRTIGDLRDILLARRGITRPGQFNIEYPNATLTREEFSSVIMMAWFHHAIMWDSPVVRDLGVEGQSSVDRLMKIGTKVGINPHPNTREFLELANPMASLLRDIECFEPNNNNSFEFELRNGIINADINVAPAALANARDRILTIINLWEKATKVKIK